MLLENRVLINLYRLFDNYIKAGRVWKDKQSFQFFVIRCHRLLTNYYEDYIKFKKTLVEHLEYEKEIQKVLQENLEDREALDSAIKTVEESYKDCEDNKRMREFLEDKSDINLPKILSSQFPEDLPMNEVNLLFDLIDFEN